MARHPQFAQDRHDERIRQGFLAVSRICPQPGCPNFRPCPTHRTTTTQRGYGSEWQRYSKAKRAAQPWCSTCGRTDDLTTDHTTDAVYCRSCHRSEAQGGVRRNLGDMGAR